MLYRRLSGILSALFVLFAPLGAMAADWGYDSQQQEDVTPMRAKAMPLGKTAPPAVPGTGAAKAKPAAANTSKGNPAAAGKPASATARPSPFARTPVESPAKTGATKTGGSAAEIAQEVVEDSWAQLYEWAGRQKMEADQRATLAAIVKARLAGSPADRADARSVLLFWPKLRTYLEKHEDQRDNYASLLRALLRWRARAELAATNNGAPGTDENASNEAALIGEVLGPQRLSVAGTIPFSEEAVNAYSDMACFIFEQQHPGKTVDALDNRAVMSTVLSQKFTNAPSKKDQEAMAAFDLAWAKFKIAWTQASAEQRKMMLESLSKTGPNAAAKQGHDPMLDAVINNWPPAPVKSPSVASGAAEDRSK